MRRVPMMALLLALACPAIGAQERQAESVLQKLCDRSAGMRSLSSRLVQTRRTELLDTPIVSSGMMYYRRDPACLVFRLTEPRKAVIYMDRTSYQVYRPDEKRLERFEFGDEGPSGALLMMFEPKIGEIGKNFSIRGGVSRDGLVEVTLEASAERVRKRLRRIVLTIQESDATLRGIAYTDSEGDDVRFELSEVAMNPDLAPSLFTLEVPSGTRVFRQTLKPDK